MSLPDNDFPQAIILFLMALTRDIVDYKYKDMKIGRLIFIINYIGYKKECTMKDIREYLNVKPSTATRQVDKLVEEMKLITRVTSETDRRKVLLKLTDIGVKVYNHHKSIQEELIHTFISKFSADEISVITKVISELSTNKKIIG